MLKFLGLALFGLFTVVLEYVWTYTFPSTTVPLWGAALVLIANVGLFYLRIGSKDRTEVNLLTAGITANCAFAALASIFPEAAMFLLYPALLALAFTGRLVYVFFYLVRQALGIQRVTGPTHS